MALTKVSYSMITGAAFNVLDYGADPTGVADSAAAIQLALDEASPVYGTVYFPAGDYKVASTLNAGNASIYGSESRQAAINYTGSSNLFGPIVSVYGIRFTGTGKTGTGIAFKIIDGYRTLIQNCQFDNIGTGIQISGSGQKIADNLFTNCGVGVHVVKYSPSAGNEPTTTFTSEKNWYELCNKGLWIDSTGAVAGMISCSSKDDIFQLNTGYGLYLSSATFPFTLINPHTEQNSAGGNYAIGFDGGSTVVWIGGYQAGGEINDIQPNVTIQKLQYSGVFAVTPYRVNNADGSKYFFEADSQTSTMSYPCQQGYIRQLFVAGDYAETNSAIVDLQGGYGDNGFIYGNFIESERTTSIGDGVNLYFGSITKGAVNDTYNRLVRLDHTGNLKVMTAGKGVTLVSPNGSVTKTLTIDNSGNLVLV